MGTACRNESCPFSGTPADARQKHMPLIAPFYTAFARAFEPGTLLSGASHIPPQRTACTPED
jgi:hypothetical protein